MLLGFKFQCCCTAKLPGMPLALGEGKCHLCLSHSRRARCTQLAEGGSWQIQILSGLTESYNLSLHCLIGMAGMRCNSFCVLSMAKDELNFSDHASETLHSHININIHLFAVMSKTSICVVATLHAFCQVTLAEATWRAKVRLPHFDS